MKKDEIAIKVEGLSKTFKVPHEKHTSLKSATLNAFKRKNFTTFEALKDVNFEIKKGEFFGIIGKNGSGKSTLLKILAGIYVADEGSVSINGKLSPFLELGVGFNPELTGRENIFLGGSILGLTRAEIEQKFDKIVKFSELDDFIDMKLKNYSSGMHVRLAFSLAINVHAEILLMDEVLAVGDSNFQTKCIEEFKNYKKLGKTVVLVTHDIGAVRQYCDRAMLIYKGKIKILDTADKVASAYIYNNIEDEEARILEAGTNLQVESCNEKEKSIVIRKVEFMDFNNTSRNVFMEREDISVRVYFDNPNRVKNLNFGFGLYDINNKYIFGTSTIADNLNTTKLIEKGYYQLNFSKPPLGSGSYYIKASVVSNGFDPGSIYSFLERSQEFKVIKNSKNEGSIILDYKWA